MPSSTKKSDRPSVPTRQATQQSIEEGFLCPIFHVPEPDLFIVMDYESKPEIYDWVMISPPGNGCEIQLALYDGNMEIFAVVQIMEFYKLQESEQWRPQIRNCFTNWLTLCALPFWAELIFGMIP